MTTLNMGEAIMSACQEEEPRRRLARRSMISTLGEEVDEDNSTDSSQWKQIPPRHNQSLHRLISATVASRHRLRLHRVHCVFVFVEELHSRILRHQGAVAAAVASDDSKLGKVYESEEAQSRERKDEDKDQNPDPEVKDQSKQNDIQNGDGMKILPFEFVSLEACLEAACSVLENEIKTLEHEVLSLPRSVLSLCTSE
ncbi:hypothetical protein PIB30_074690, partial [Stylosanthes scabra]|nr:hypothetical protein [Stylosanthes scabra]